MSNEAADGDKGALTARLRAAAVVAWAQLAGLILCLAAVEAVRAAVRPFFGLAVLGGARTPVRYAAFLASAAVILAVRALQGDRLRLRAGETDPAWLGRIFRTSILVLILAELPALLGLALFLLGGYNRDFYALLFVSLFLMFMYFPRASAWQARRAGCGRACPR